MRALAALTVAMLVALTLPTASAEFETGDEGQHVLSRVKFELKEDTLRGKRCPLTLS